MNSAAYSPHAADDPIVGARHFLRHCLDNGVRVWLTYGSIGEVEGWVLTAGRQSAEIQDATDGRMVRVAYSAIMELVEA